MVTGQSLSRRIFGGVILDFFTITTKEPKKGIVEVFPKFVTNRRVKDLLIRGNSRQHDFYGVWRDDISLWSTDEQDALDAIDKALDDYVNEHSDKWNGLQVIVDYTWDSTSGTIDRWKHYIEHQMYDNSISRGIQLDTQIKFADSPVSRTDYVSKKLPYKFGGKEKPCYEEIMSTLYSPEERRKIEWAIGSIINGDSRKIQKFIVIYGPPRSGKSTVLNIVEKLFPGYYCAFEAKALGSSSNQFAFEAFRDNPLIAIQQDGDLSKIEDNSRLNSLVSHEDVLINIKNKSAFSMRLNSFIFMGTNKPVYITDAKSGILRRLIDVSPVTDKRIERDRYDELVAGVDFELGAIAEHCLRVYNEKPNYYEHYIPTRMLGASNDFYNFILYNFDIFKRDDCVTQKAAWEMYKDYCDMARIYKHLTYNDFGEELKNYFKEFNERGYDGETRVRNLYSGFLSDKFTSSFNEDSKPKPKKFIFNCTKSLLDKELADCKAQYATTDEKPKVSWDNVKTTLSDISSYEIHYVKPPENMIVIDFDIKDADGNKSFELNREAAEKWPATYAELSKSGSGIHLHYYYTGDISELSNLYDKDIEVKTFPGKSSLRRKLTKCNNLQVATISSGLPKKVRKNMTSNDDIKNDQHLRALIIKGLKKEVHPSTVCSVSFIKEILDKAYESDIHYDLTSGGEVSLERSIYNFASNSTNNKDKCLAMCRQMHFKSKEPIEAIDIVDDSPIFFFDLEVHPNRNLIVYKERGAGKPFNAIWNPSPALMSEIIKKKLIGHNCRRYDNHVMHCIMLGGGPADVFELSKRIVGAQKGAKNDSFYPAAYNHSYCDTFDYPVVKQSLKKWEIQLEIPHQEMDIPWDQPLPDELMDKVVEYCKNDVAATEAVFEATQPDYIARCMLVDICKALGVSAVVNDTTNTLTTKMLFGKERKPKLAYFDLSKEFPGYYYISASESEDHKQHNMYRGEDAGFGGYVYAQPGMYGRVKCYDVASMHPHSIIAMNCLGEYTQRFKDLVDIRILIKHGDYEAAGKLLNGALQPYLKDKSDAKSIANALKIAINSVYGLTSASFDNPFNNFGYNEKGEYLNRNNIVALRGALFMINLKNELQSRGVKVIHIKTDSIKVVDPSDEIEQFILDYGKSYGYSFEVEEIFERICLVNNAVYIAKLAKDDPEHPGEWTATGAQFAEPYIFKSLFTKEPVEYRDYWQTKSVDTAIYIDFNESKLSDLSPQTVAIPDKSNYHFIGKVGSFVPVAPGTGGGILLRQDKNDRDKFSAVNDTKGYRWKEREMSNESEIDISYFRKMADDAIESISRFGDFEMFANGEELIFPDMTSESPVLDDCPFDPPYKEGSN